VLFRCWHRGTQENDLILGAFAKTSLARLDSIQLDQFAALLDCPDTDLFDWNLGGSQPPLEHDNDVLRLLRGFSAPGVITHRFSATDSIKAENRGATDMERPTSPFMFPTWYRFQVTSALSILSGLTGIALAAGSILLAH
jgi:succinate dehydrogenase flavin-adding protein (antitoxin of CptAB toxin-antitoxin module)